MQVTLAVFHLSGKEPEITLFRKTLYRLSIETDSQSFKSFGVKLSGPQAFPSLTAVLKAFEKSSLSSLILPIVGVTRYMCLLSDTLVGREQAFYQHWQRN